MRPDRLPRPLRLAVYGLAVAVLLYLCLAPTDKLPPDSDLIWDKAEHSLAWLVLAGLGLALWPVRPRTISLFTLGLGAAVEVLQATMGFGRDGDWRDFVADSLGVATALLAWALIRRWAARR